MFNYQPIPKTKTITIIVAWAHRGCICGNFRANTLQPMNGMGIIFIPIYLAGFLFGALYLAISHWLDRKVATM
jgi:hypothetical protein